MSLAQIGEFSFIIAGLGLSLRATGSFLYPIAVAGVGHHDPHHTVVHSGVRARRELRRPQGATSAADVRLAVRKLAAEPRRGHAREDDGARIRRLIRLLVLDALLLGSLGHRHALGVTRLSQYFEAKFAIAPTMARSRWWPRLSAWRVPLAAGVARLARRWASCWRCARCR